MLIGVDIGTQSLKIAVTDLALAMRGEARRSYAVQFSGPDRAEQDPRLWEASLGPAISEALAASLVTKQQVTGLSICGQLDGCIPVGKHGELRGPCLTWMDRRAAADLAQIDTNRVHAVNGIVPDASHLAAKILWLKRHGGEPGMTVRYHQPVSYMVERLTGANVVDHALASTSMLYDLRAQDYDSALLAAFEVVTRELPGIAHAGDCAGKLSAQGSAITGLPQGVPVAVGTGDDFSTPLGAGLSEPGQVSVAIGTGEVVGALFADPLIDQNRLVETHAYPAGGYFIENPGWLSGGAVAWLRDLLRVESFNGFDLLAAEAPVGSEGLLFLPALTGAMSPEWNAGARGCFYGMTPAHGARHLARSLLEGCGFAMRDVLARLEALGARPSSLTLLAGGSLSRLWAQIRSDIAGVPVTLPRHTHCSVIGAAMLAGVASGAFKRVKDATALAAKPQARLISNPTAAATLDQSYQRYRQLFSSLKPLFARP